MRLITAATIALCFANAAGGVQASMQQAFYPVLLGVLLLASLGVPIPEDVPLIAAGVLLNTHAGIATWPGTFLVALIGIMAGDLVLYQLGRHWGPDVVNHRYVRRLITPALFRRATDKFHRYGMWYCLIGRFIMGIRAGMCLTAGATGFPYWRFFLADGTGALLSIPAFVYLGYWFARMIPTLRLYLTGIEGLLAIAVVAIFAALGYAGYRRRRRRRDALDALRPSPRSFPAAPRSLICGQHLPPIASSGSCSCERLCP